MKVQILSLQEAATSGFTHRVELTHEDLTETTANTAQTVEILSVDPGDAVMACAMKLVTPFEDASDNAFNTTTLIVGDDGNDDRFLTSTECNVNGSEVDFLATPNSVDSIPYAYLAANTVDAKFGSMAAKSLSNIDVGEVHIFLKVARLNDLSAAIN